MRTVIQEITNGMKTQARQLLRSGGTDTFDELGWRFEEGSGLPVLHRNRLSVCPC